jgi:hypothetical protein
VSELVAIYNAAYALSIGASFRVAYLFCLLGLALTLAIAPMLPFGDLAWAVAHVE